MVENVAPGLAGAARTVAVARAVVPDDGSPEAFDRLTRLAATTLRAPMALLTFVDGERQFLESCVGLPEPWASQRDGRLTHSFGQHATASASPLVIEDARVHPLVRNDPLTRAIGGIACAAVSLRAADGSAYGSISVVDTRPRRWERAELDILQGLASAVVTQVELRRAARDREQERERSAALLECVAHGIIGVDADMRCTMLNETAARMLGWTREETLGRNMHALMHHSHADGTPYHEDECPIVNAVRGGVSGRVSGEVLWRRDGTTVPVEYSCAPVRTDGRITGAILHVTDVSERRRTDDALALLADAGVLLNSSLDLRLTLDSLAQLVVGRLADGCSVRMARDDGTFELVAVASRDADKARLVEEIGTRYSVSPTAPLSYPRVIRTGEPELHECVTDDFLAALARDGEHLALLRRLDMRSLMVVPLNSRGRTMAAMVLVSLGPKPRRPFDTADLALAMELGRRAALAVDNALAYERAGAASRAKSEFLAMMSHEFRTPLNAIIGYTQLLEAEIAGPLAPEQRAFLLRSRDSSAHLLGLISDVLDLSRIEAGQLAVTRTAARLLPVAEAAVLLVAPDAARRGVQLARHFPAGADPRYVGDEDRVRQILVNLLSNAVKFTPTGGQVGISHERARPVAGARVEGEGPWLAVRVSDTGIGIAPTDLQRIFEPFVQVESGLTRRAGGTGLGLAISRRLARLMGGDLTAESTLGKGSTFTLWLPDGQPSRNS